MTIRCFTAVLLPAEVRSVIAGTMRELDRRLRELRCPSPKWERAENLHCTLNFFGETEESVLAEFIAAARPLLKNVGTMHLRINRLGVFPGSRSPRILWIGMEDEAHRVHAAQRALDELAAAMGMRHEDGRDFQPHITIGRWKNARNSQVDLPTAILEEPHDFGSIIVDSIALMRSVTGPEGAAYAVVETMAVGEV